MVRKGGIRSVGESAAHRANGITFAKCHSCHARKWIVVIDDAGGSWLTGWVMLRSVGTRRK